MAGSSHFGGRAELRTLEAMARRRMSAVIVTDILLMLEDRAEDEGREEAGDAGVPQELELEVATETLSEGAQPVGGEEEA